MKKMLMLLVCLSGCATLSTRPVAEPVELAKIPAALKQVCRGVVSLPDRDLTQIEVARLWSRDRSALGECARRQRGLAKAVTALEGQAK